MKFKMIRLVLLASVLSMARSFLSSVPAITLERHFLSFQTEQSYPRSLELSMAVKKAPTDKESNEETGSASRLMVLGGLFRNDEKQQDKVEETAQKEDDGNFLKRIGSRLTFRRGSEDVNGFTVSGDPLNAKNQKISKTKKQQELIQDEKNLAKEKAKKEAEEKRAQQRMLVEERKRKKQAELEAKREEMRQAELKKIWAEQKREQERMVKELDTKKAAKGAEEATKKRKTPSSVAGKFLSNIGKKKSESDEAKSSESEKGIGSKISNLWGNTVGSFGKDDAEWVPVLPKTRVSPGEIVPVQIQGIDLLVVASRDGKIHCIANTCAHLGTPLETGRLESRPIEDGKGGAECDDPNVKCEDCIVCPLHQTAFSLETGEVRGSWCPHPPVLGSMIGAVKKTTPLATFELRTRGKNVEVRINSSLEPEEKVIKKKAKS